MQGALFSVRREPCAIIVTLPGRLRWSLSRPMRPGVRQQAVSRISLVTLHFCLPPRPVPGARAAAFPAWDHDQAHTTAIGRRPPAACKAPRGATLLNLHRPADVLAAELQAAGGRGVRTTPSAAARLALPPEPLEPLQAAPPPAGSGGLGSACSAVGAVGCSISGSGAGTDGCSVVGFGGAGGCPSSDATCPAGAAAGWSPVGVAVAGGCPGAAGKAASAAGSSESAVVCVAGTVASAGAGCTGMGVVGAAGGAAGGAASGAAGGAASGAAGGGGAGGGGAGGWQTSLHHRGLA